MLPTRLFGLFSLVFLVASLSCTFTQALPSPAVNNGTDASFGRLDDVRKDFQSQQADMDDDFEGGDGEDSDEEDSDTEPSDALKGYSGYHYHDNKYDYYYDKKGKYDKGKKYDKYDKYEKFDKECHKDKSFECVAYVGTIGLNAQSIPVAQLFQSINGQDTTLSSTYFQNYAVGMGAASNRARGAYCVEHDIELVVGTVDANSDENSFLSRFEATSNGASRVYTHETGIALDNVPNIVQLVTRILLKRMYTIIDAYFTEFSFGYAQYDVNPLTNTKCAVSFPQSICYDTAFFKNDCTRFLCQGETGTVMTTYSRDPETGVNFVPPQSNNPWVTGFGQWYTSVRQCNKNYISSIGWVAGTPNQVIVQRARYSLKYPYFKDIETVYVDDSGVADPGDDIHIYTPAHTNTIFACYGTVFIRIDDAYTVDVPITTPDQVGATTGNCRRLISFNKCPHEIYVLTATNTLEYSNDGGASFSSVTLTGGNLAHALTGFSKPVKDYY